MIVSINMYIYDRPQRKHRTGRLSFSLSRSSRPLFSPPPRPLSKPAMRIVKKAHNPDAKITRYRAGQTPHYVQTDDGGGGGTGTGKTSMRDAFERGPSASASASTSASGRPRSPTRRFTAATSTNVGAVPSTAVQHPRGAGPSRAAAATTATIIAASTTAITTTHTTHTTTTTTTTTAESLPAPATDRRLLRLAAMRGQETAGVVDKDKTKAAEEEVEAPRPRRRRPIYEGEIVQQDGGRPMMAVEAQPLKVQPAPKKEHQVQEQHVHREVELVDDEIAARRERFRQRKRMEEAAEQQQQQQSSNLKNGHVVEDAMDESAPTATSTMPPPANGARQASTRAEDEEEASSGEEESSAEDDDEDDDDDDDEQPPVILYKPKFVSKSKRETVVDQDQIEAERLEAERRKQEQSEERKQESHRIVEGLVRKDYVGDGKNAYDGYLSD